MALQSHLFPSARRILFLALVATLIGFVWHPGLRGADSATQATDYSLATNNGEYSSDEACGVCHPNQLTTFQRTKMGPIVMTAKRNDIEEKGCQSCHGPGLSHVESSGDLSRIIRFGKEANISLESQSAKCLECHENGQRQFWNGGMHESRGLTCGTCHNVMDNSGDSTRFIDPLTQNKLFVKSSQGEVCFQCHKQRRAQMQRSAHMPMREGKIACASCHNPHGSPNPKLLQASSANETCASCHAERRGPFLWEHPPVLENCTNCHEPHGSTNPQLLKVRYPRLCQRCHIETRHPTTPREDTTRFVFNRGCLNCHSQIHGSNHPSGVRLQR